MKILIVEDDPGVGELLSRLLAGPGVDIQHFHSFSDAMVEFSNSNMPADLITLDLNLKDSDAVRTLHMIPEIRRNHPLALLVIFTGILRKEDRAKALELGADEFFLKGPEMFSEKQGFLRGLRDVAMGLIREPQKYKRNTEMLLVLANLLVARLDKQRTVESNQLPIQHV